MKPEADTKPEASEARLWIEAECGSVESVLPLRGGAGRRRYWRVVHGDGSSSVLVHAVPEDPAILPPALRADSALPLHDSPFVQITRLLQLHGIPVPAIRALDPERDWMLLEDLGDRHLGDLPDAERLERTGELLALLARVHAIPRSDALPFRRHFDAEWVGFELRLFLELVEEPRLRDELQDAFAGLGRWIAALPQVLCLRDLQSRNVLVDARGALRLIDYQDALLAPRELDLAALLHDSYVEIGPRARDELLERYARAAGIALDPDALAALTAQRKCKDYSRFHRLSKQGREAEFGPARARAAAALRAACPRLERPLGGLIEHALDALGAPA